MGEPGEPYDPNPPAPPYPTAYPPQYAQQYPQSYQQPYQQPYPQPYGYPPAPYPGYPPQPYGPRRPGVTTAANVLAYVAAGLLITAGFLLFFGASVVNSFDAHSVITAELVLDGVLDLVAGGLLIAGAVSFGGRNPTGRVMLSVGSGIVLGESVYWIARFHDGATFWALLFAALVIIALSFAWSSSSNQWIRGAAG